MSSQRFDDALIKAVAIKQGISPDEAALYAEALKEDMGGASNVERWMGNLAANADTISRLPEGAQKDVINLIGVEAMSGRRSGSGDDDIDRSAKKLALLGEVLRPKNDDSAALAEIRVLQKAVADLTTRSEKEQFENFKKDVLDKFDTRLDSIEKQVSAPTGAPRTPDAMKATLAEVENAKNTINGFRTMLGMPPLEETQRATPEETPEQLKAKLERAGYEVKGPLTRQAMVEMFDEERKKIRKETEEKVKDELQVTEKTVKMAFELGQTILEQVLPTLGEGQKGQGLAKLGNVLSAVASTVSKNMGDGSSTIDTAVA